MIRARVRQGCDRWEKYRSIFGEKAIELESLVPELATVPGLGRMVVYKVKVSALTQQEMALVVKYLVDEFTVSEEEVKKALQGKHGIPILAHDLIVWADKEDLEHAMEQVVRLAEVIAGVREWQRN